MRYTRRDIGKLALSALPASLLARPLTAIAQTKPNSTINGVRVGAITYSYRTMPDQSAEATLRYIVDSGISQIEFMGPPSKRLPALRRRRKAAVAAAAAKPPSSRRRSVKRRTS